MRTTNANATMTVEALAERLGVPYQELLNVIGGPLAGVLTACGNQAGGGRGRGRPARLFRVEDVALSLLMLAERVGQIPGMVTIPTLVRHLGTTWLGAAGVVILVRTRGITASLGMEVRPHQAGRRAHLYAAQDLQIGLELLAVLLRSDVAMRQAA